MSVKTVERTWKDKRSGSDYVRLFIEGTWRYSDGRRVFVRKVAQVQTKDGAEFEAQQIVRSLLDDTYGRKAVKEIPTLREYAKTYLAGYVATNNKPSTQATREGDLRRYILPALGGLRLDEIGKAEIRRLVTDLAARKKKARDKKNEKKLNAKTINNALDTLSKLLRCAEEDELIATVPRIKPLPETAPTTEYLSPSDLAKLLDAARYNTEWHDMIFFCAHTGVRYGELSELRWGDFDLESNRATVRRSVWKKTVDKGRKEGDFVTIPLSPDVVDLVQRRRVALRSARNFKLLRKDALVFCKPDGGRHIHRRADVALKRCCKRAKIDPIGWHRLRHTFASGLANAQAPLLEIKELCGHRDIKSTLRYAHLSDAAKRAAVAALDNHYREGAQQVSLQESCKGGK